MNQIGPVFREARTRSGKTIDDATRETKIAKKYLNAIENENFDIFPGETYLIGFLRNYAQFLGLDPDEMVLKYKDYKIQEQPAPIEQLTARPKNKKKQFLIILVFIMIISTVLYVILSGEKGEREIAKETEKKVKQEKDLSVQQDTNIIVFEEEEVIKDFKKGDIIEFPLRNKKHSISIDGIDENLDLSIADIPFSLSTDEHMEIDFDRDGRKDLLIRANRFDEGAVNLTLKKLYKTNLLDKEISPLMEKKDEDQERPSEHPEVVIIKDDDLLSPVPVAPKTGFKIVSSYEKTDINMFVKTKSTIYFGYYIDDGNKEEALLKNGEELSVSAKDILRITAANAKGADIEINNIPVILGESRQVVAKVVRWYRDSENEDLYHLVIDDWEK